MTRFDLSHILHPTGLSPRPEGPVYAPALLDADAWDDAKIGKQIQQTIDALPAAQLPRALLDCLADYALDHHTNVDGLNALLTAAGIKAKDSAKLLADELKAREAAAAAAKEAAKKPSKAVTPAIEAVNAAAKKAVKGKNRGL